MCNNDCSNCNNMELMGDEDNHTFYPFCSKRNEMPTESEIKEGWLCNDFKQIEGR